MCQNRSNSLLEDDQTVFIKGPLKIEKYEGILKRYNIISNTNKKKKILGTELSKILIKANITQPFICQSVM